MRTIVYVNGFNLYYRALKGTSWKWLDLPALFAKILQPHHEILTVKYFTEKVSATLPDRSKPQRQRKHRAHDAHGCGVGQSGACSGLGLERW